MNRPPDRLLIVIVILGAVLAAAAVRLNSALSAGDRTLRQDSSQEQASPFDQAHALADLTKQIAGKEDKPAAEVFKNIQLLKAMPAGRLLKVMELGYSKSLGVNCTHCHVVDQWDKDE